VIGVGRRDLAREHFPGAVAHATETSRTRESNVLDAPAPA
jgi:hypothetical protein